MKNRLLLFIPIFLIQIFPIKFWTQCRDFLDYYHFSLYDLELQLNYAVNFDYKFPIIVARFFHNKGVQFMIDFYKRYTHFFDWQLLISLLSFLGVFGVLLGIWYYLNSKQKNKKVTLLIVASFLFPLVEVLFNPEMPFILNLLLIVVPFNLLSIYGHYKFLKNQKIRLAFTAYLVLFILSLSWVFTIPEQVFKYCAEI